MLRITVPGEDCDFVPARLQADGGVDDEALGAPDAEVWVEEDDVVLLARHLQSLSRHPVRARERIGSPLARVSQIDTSRLSRPIGMQERRILVRCCPGGTTTTLISISQGKAATVNSFRTWTTRLVHES